jgi:hypothetical protein
MIYVRLDMFRSTVVLLQDHMKMGSYNLFWFTEEEYNLNLYEIITFKLVEKCGLGSVVTSVDWAL